MGTNAPFGAYVKSQTNADGSVSLVGAGGVIDTINRSNTPVVLYDGDSITARGKPLPSFPSVPGAANFYSGYGDHGYPTWERGMLGTPYSILNQAVSGETIEQITTRLLATDFSPYAVISLMCGMNNAGGTSAFTDVAGDMAMIQSVVDRAAAYRKPLRILTITPREATEWTADNRAYVLGMNSAIRALPKKHPHVFVGDAFWTMQTQTSADPDPDTGMLAAGDTTHPSKKGAYRIARYAGVDSLRAALRYAGYSRVIEAGRPVIETGYTELLTNTDFKTQTGGTDSTAGILTVGTVPSGWRLSNTSCTNIKSYFPFYVPEATRQRGMWATGMVLETGDAVTNAGAAYIALTAHTAGATFAGDAANWQRVWATDYCWQVEFTGDAADDGITILRAANVAGTPADVVRGIFGVAAEGEVAKIKSFRPYLEQWSDAAPGPSRGHFNDAIFPDVGSAESAVEGRVEGMFFTQKQAPFSAYTGALAVNQYKVLATLNAAGTASVILYAPSMRKY